MNKVILSLTISSLLMAGILAISFQDAEAKVNAAPIKRIQVKAVDPLGEPVPNLTCDYVYDSILPLKRTITTNDEGVVNDKLDPKPTLKNEITEFDCPGWLLIPNDSPFEKFPIPVIKLSEKTLTKIKLTVEPSESVCPEGHIGYLFEGDVDTSELEEFSPGNTMSTTVCVDPESDSESDGSLGIYTADVISARIGNVVIDPSCPDAEAFNVFNGRVDSIVVACKIAGTMFVINPAYHTSNNDKFADDSVPIGLTESDFVVPPDSLGFRYSENFPIEIAQVKGTITKIFQIQ